MLALEKNPLMLFRRLRCTSWFTVAMIEFGASELGSALEKTFGAFDTYCLISVQQTMACLSSFLQLDITYR